MTSDYNTHDRFELRIFFKTNHLESWGAARPFLETVLGAADYLAPTTFWKRYDKGEPLNLGEIKAQLGQREPPDVLFFSNESGVTIEWAGFHKAKNPASKLLMRIPFSLLCEPGPIAHLLALASAVCQVCPPVYGWGHSEEDARLGGDPHVTNPWAPKEVVQVYWLTILGAAIVRKLKRALVAGTPAHEVKFLDDGSAMIVTSSLPGDLFSPAAREEQAKALAHLRPDREAGRIRRALLDRSARLQPVERNWDPDLAPIFKAIVEAVPLADRRGKELEFNDYRPPEITECVPATVALPADVNDTAAAVDSFHRQGETFVAGFHSEIQDLVAAEPDSLPWVDLHFYFRDYRRDTDQATLEQLMVPTLGAHLGNVLERFLGGSWVPRRNLDESQIIVGDQAWLPFLRARRFVQSQQAALDYSLWRFYCEAQRHAPDEAGQNE